MRIFFIVAFSLIASGAVQAQYFAFNTDVGPIEIDIGRRYVRVPGYVELGARPYLPPPPTYYGPPTRSYYGPPREAVVPPRGMSPEIVDDPDEPIFYERSPRRYEAQPRVRQPRQVTTAPPKKQPPKVAAVRDASPPRASANRAAAPVQAPLPSPPQAVSVPASPQPQPDIGGAQTPATPSVALPAAAPVAASPPPVAATPAPAGETATPVVAAPPAPAPPVAAISPAPAPPPVVEVAIAPKPDAEVQKSLLERASPPKVAVAPAAAPQPEKPQVFTTPPRPAAAPEVAAVAPKPAPAATTPTPLPTTAAPKDPPTAAKPAKTQVAALPTAKQETEERAKAGPMPIGTWNASDGQLRIDRCGQNLCGYAVGGAHAGKMVLIHMRQTRENSWSGQVKDVRSGQNYSATMSMRGSGALHIQGCAMGGLFCGSRTMSRVH